MKQGEICLTFLNPVKGSEHSGTRPVVILSGNLLNTHLPLVICCPLTSKIKNCKGNIVLKPNSDNKHTQESAILLFHIRSLSKDRLFRKIGNIGADDIELLKKGLNEILTY